jgi:hypothetical protein
MKLKTILFITFYFNCSIFIFCQKNGQKAIIDSTIACKIYNFKNFNNKGIPFCVNDSILIFGDWNKYLIFTIP